MLINPFLDFRLNPSYTVIHFVRVSAKFGTCSVVSVNGTPVEDKMRRSKGECAHFSFNKCPIYTADGANAKFSTNSHETDNIQSTAYEHCLTAVILIRLIHVERAYTMNKAMKTPGLNMLFVLRISNWLLHVAFYQFLFIPLEKDTI
jgi:hypothetical protein